MTTSTSETPNESADAAPPLSGSTSAEAVAFDFDGHRISAEEAYRQVRGTYEDFANTIRDILTDTLRHAGLTIHSIEARAKELDSFGKKAASPHEEEPEKPKYAHPLTDITDLTAARVITFFLSTLDEVDNLIRAEFKIEERNDRGGEKAKEARLGYQSIHYLVRLKENRLSLPEYARFRGLIAELQVRTILQHAWAEIEHEIQYKAVDVLPKAISRRFLALAGMLEIGDREFQGLANDHKQLQVEARERIATGNLEQVELTSDSLKVFLNKRLGEDGRMRDWSYDFATRMLKHLGFTTIEQVDHALTGYNDDLISRIIHGGSRMGQITRFEDVLLTSMGDGYKLNHPWSGNETTWFEANCEQKLRRLEQAGIEIGNYDPWTDV
ncbi:GTP pyrophosphokinase [Mycolicibacterium llatzerense]|uniref:GTP pyrophosphokinase n=1 Tax=Mycolicibacterium llatzerense TaxID=280871 RepID=UPI000AD90FA1|nr:RelA/SpoT domain-containing protein [Mycolicibacterium llatzerense]